MLLPPGRLELSRREIPQRRVNALRPIDIIDEVPDLGQRVLEILVVRQCHLLFFNGADQPFRVAVLGTVRLLDKLDGETGLRMWKAKTRLF